MIISEVILSVDRMGTHIAKQTLFWIKSECTLNSLDGVVPYDGSCQDVLDYTHLAITIILSVLGIFGLVFVLVALIFNISFRKKR